jgi:hypothetical protein
LAVSVGEDCRAFLLARALWKFYYANWLKDGKKIGWSSYEAGQGANDTLRETISNGWNI